MFKRTIASIICFTFILSNFQYAHAYEFSIDQLPKPGVMVETSPAFVPIQLKGITVDKKNPLAFKFLVDTGNTHYSQEKLKSSVERQVRYFMAALTSKEEDLWVNLSPFEKDKIVVDPLGKTELGRDMLAQDYILKQLSSSLINPDKALGKKFWQGVYQKAKEQFGTTNLPVATFHKIWIIPGDAVIYDNENGAVIVKSNLKVMLDEDYLAMKKQSQMSSTVVKGEAAIATDVMRQVIIPEVEKEINTGENFIVLRQLYEALILAKWYKEDVQNRLLEKLYYERNKTTGLLLHDEHMSQGIYGRYVSAYKKGVFNFVKEEEDQKTGNVVPRKYFSGGENFVLSGIRLKRSGNSAMLSKGAIGSLMIFGVAFLSAPQSALAEEKDPLAEVVKLEKSIDQLTDDEVIGRVRKEYLPPSAGYNLGNTKDVLTVTIKELFKRKTPKAIAFQNELMLELINSKIMSDEDPGHVRSSYSFNILKELGAAAFDVLAKTIRETNDKDRQKWCLFLMGRLFVVDVRVLPFLKEIDGHYSQWGRVELANGVTVGLSNLSDSELISRLTEPNQYRLIVTAAKRALFNKTRTLEQSLKLIHSDNREVSDSVYSGVISQIEDWEWHNVPGFSEPPTLEQVSALMHSLSLKDRLIGYLCLATYQKQNYLSDQNLYKLVIDSVLPDIGRYQSELMKKETGENNRMVGRIFVSTYGALIKSPLKANLFPRNNQQEMGDLVFNFMTSMPEEPGSFTGGVFPYHYIRLFLDNSPLARRRLFDIQFYKGKGITEIDSHLSSVLEIISKEDGEAGSDFVFGIADNTDLKSFDFTDILSNLIPALERLHYPRMFSFYSKILNKAIETKEYRFATYHLGNLPNEGEKALGMLPILIKLTKDESIKDVDFINKMKRLALGVAISVDREETYAVVFNGIPDVLDGLEPWFFKDKAGFMKRLYKAREKNPQDLIKLKEYFKNNLLRDQYGFSSQLFNELPDIFLEIAIEGSTSDRNRYLDSKSTEIKSKDADYVLEKVVKPILLKYTSSEDLYVLRKNFLEVSTKYLLDNIKSKWGKPDFLKNAAKDLQQLETINREEFLPIQKQIQDEANKRVEEQRILEEKRLSDNRIRQAQLEEDKLRKEEAAHWAAIKGYGLKGLGVLATLAALGFIVYKVSKKPENKAMLVENTGGIDLTDVSLVRQGPGIIIDYDPAMMEKLFNSVFYGFKPEITNVINVQSPLSFLDMPKEEVLLAKS